MTCVRWFRADGNSIRLCTWRCIGSVLTKLCSWSTVECACLVCRCGVPHQPWNNVKQKSSGGDTRPRIGWSSVFHGHVATYTSLQVTTDAGNSMPLWHEFHKFHFDILGIRSFKHHLCIPLISKKVNCSNTTLVGTLFATFVKGWIENSNHCSKFHPHSSWILMTCDHLPTVW
jgi:hypothetical protein